MIQDLELHPTKEKKRFVNKAPINRDRVRGNFIELRFTFTSLYSAELNDPPNLKGEIVKKYQYVNGRIFPPVE